MGSDSRSLAILLSACDKYAPLAKLTASRLDQLWAAHPPIYFSGLSPGALDSGNLAPLTCVATDWMLVTRQACEYLLERGFKLCYLVLDDHPPFGPCHAVHLNETLPDLMMKLKAMSISLLGWGQGRTVRGTVLGADRCRLECLPADYLWRFSLHPGLWDLRKLTGLLQHLIESTSPTDHTAWKFERVAGEAKSRSENETCYKVHGLSLARHPFALPRAFALSGMRGAADLVRVIRRRLLQNDGADELLFRGAYHFYDGPYPMFWSGLMQKGKLNRDVISFLKWRREGEFIAQVLAAAPAS